MFCREWEETKDDNGYNIENCRHWGREVRCNGDTRYCLNRSYYDDEGESDF